MLADVSLLTSWTLDPVAVAVMVAGSVLYVRRLRRLWGKGVDVPSWKPVAFFSGMLLLAIALFSPLDAVGEQELFSAHMAQHVLLGDLAPLLLLSGLSGPLLRPVLALPIVQRLRVLAHPLVALPIWAASLYIWHLPVLYGAAIEHEWVHALEHMFFFTGGLIMWAPVLEILPAPAWFGTAWKLAYMVVVRLVETVLANIFFWWGTVLYSQYTDGNQWGFSPLADQGTAGAVMMVEGSIVTLIALGWLFLRLAKEGELRQELVERGLDPTAVDRAVRYGRADELA